MPKNKKRKSIMIETKAELVTENEKKEKIGSAAREI